MSQESLVSPSFKTTRRTHYGNQIRVESHPGKTRTQVLCLQDNRKKVGKLEKAHLKARSKGGSQLLPMCPNCHQRFDMILLLPTECKRIGVDYTDYVKRKYAPRKSRPKRDEGFGF